LLPLSVVLGDPDDDGLDERDAEEEYAQRQSRDQSSSPLSLPPPPPRVGGGSRGAVSTVVVEEYAVHGRSGGERVVRVCENSAYLM
jgi:hypothetical protein